MPRALIQQTLTAIGQRTNPFRPADEEQPFHVTVTGSGGPPSYLIETSPDGVNWAVMSGPNSGATPLAPQSYSYNIDAQIQPSEKGLFYSIRYSGGTGTMVVRFAQ